MRGGARSGRFCGAIRMFARPQERFTAERAEKAGFGASREAPPLVFTARSACSAVNLAVLPSFPGTARLLS
jgi:hypothetical protein